MRILQLVTQTKVGGAESFALFLSVALERRGHTVRLLAHRQNGPLFELAPPGLERAACPRTSRLDPRLPFFLARHLREFRPDVIHGHNFPANFWARMMGAFFRAPKIVCHEHSGRILARAENRFVIDRLLNGRTSFVVPVSEEIAQVLRVKRVIAPEKIRRVPVGIDTARFRIPSADGSAGGLADEAILPEEARGRPRALHVASFLPVKNHTLLLEAFVGVAAATRGVLLLAGDGPLRATIEERVARPDLSGRVFLLGHRSDIPALLSLSSVFVLPSEAEGLPLSILEAMAAGVMPIASRVGAIPEVVADGVVGRLFAPGDRRALTDALLEAFRDPERAARMGALGRAEVEAKYSIDAVASEIEALYLEAGAGRD